VFKIKYGENLGLQKIQVEQEELETIDELKVRQRAKEMHENIVKAFVTFESIKTKNLVERLFWKTSYKKLLRVSEICARKRQRLRVKELEKNKYERIKVDRKQWGELIIIQNYNPNQMYFVEEFEDKDDQDFTVRTPDSDPEFIKWQNISASKISRLLRTVLVLLGFAIVLGLVSLILHLFYQRVQINQHSFYESQLECPDK
jgi:hypothetical protein